MCRRLLAVLAVLAALPAAAHGLGGWTGPELPPEESGRSWQQGRHDMPHVELTLDPATAGQPRSARASAALAAHLSANPNANQANAASTAGLPLELGPLIPTHLPVAADDGTPELAPVAAAGRQRRDAASGPASASQSAARCDEDAADQAADTDLMICLGLHQLVLDTRMAEDVSWRMESLDKPGSTDSGTLRVYFFGPPSPVVMMLDDANVNTVHVTTNFGYGPVAAVTLPQPTRRLTSSAGDGALLWAYGYGGFKGIVFSSDNGTTWQVSAAAPSYVVEVVAHPTRPQTVLVGVLHSSSRTLVDVYLYHDLTVASAAPQLIATQVASVDWMPVTADGSADILLTRVPDVTNVTDTFLLRFAAPSYTTPTTLRSNCYDFEQDSGFIFVTDVPRGADNFNEGLLHVSSDRGDTFVQAHFPIKGHANHYSIVDASEGMALVAVQHTHTEDRGDYKISVTSPGSPPTTLEIDDVEKALFSPALSGPVAAALAYNTDNPTGCGDSGGISAATATGKVLVIERGECPFVEKTQLAEDAGAVAVVIVNYEDRLVYMRAPDGTEDLPDIPAFFVTKRDGGQLISAITASGGKAIASLSEDSVHEQATWRTSNLYMSDPTATIYTVSLHHALYFPPNTFTNMPQEVVSVYKVASQEGTYIANFVNPTKHTLESVVTFSRGAIWSPLMTDCEVGDVCQVHLALDYATLATGVPGPRSVTQAPGLIIANAFQGAGVTFKTEDVNTFISRDGGHTWDQVLVGANTFNILDHGGIIVSLPYGKPATVVSVTAEYGLNHFYETMKNESVWLTKPILLDADKTPVPVQVAGTVTDPDGASLIALFYFYASGQWSIHSIDFSQLLPVACTSSDYETYTPEDADCGRDCDGALLGIHREYKRRLPCSLCHNGLDHEKAYDAGEAPADQTICPCSLWDLQCAPGFYRDLISNYSAPDPPSCLRDDFDLEGYLCQGSESTVSVPRYVIADGNSCDQSKLSKTITDLLAPKSVACDVSTTPSPTASPTTMSTFSPTAGPTPKPTRTPTKAPTVKPGSPTQTPTTRPTVAPGTPTQTPTSAPTKSSASTGKDKSHSSKHMAIIVVAVILVLAIVAVVAFLVYRYSPSARSTVNALFGSKGVQYSELSEVSGGQAGGNDDDGNESDDDLLAFADDTPTLHATGRVEFADHQGGSSNTDDLPPAQERPSQAELAPWEEPAADAASPLGMARIPTAIGGGAGLDDDDDDDELLS